MIPPSDEPPYRLHLNRFINNLPGIVLPSSATELDALVSEFEGDAEILETAAVAVRSLVADLTLRRARTHNAAQPILRLPDELLSDIFEFGITLSTAEWTVDPLMSEATRWTPSQFEFKLRSILATCSRFRSCLLASPRCWRYVRYTHSGNESRPNMDELAAILVRSKSCTFHLTLELLAKAAGPDPDAMSLLSSTIAPHMNRCQRLHFICDSLHIDFPHFFFPNPSHTLRYLAFDWEQDDEDSESDELHRAETFMISLINGLRAPLLSLTIRGWHNDDQFSPRTFDFIQAECLKRLRIDVCHDTRDILALLQRCVNLEHFHWTYYGVNDTDGIPTLVSPHLISLCMDHLVKAETFDFYLTAPKLEQINLYGGKITHPVVFQHPEHSTFPNLRRLALEVPENRSESEDLVSFLQRHPQITDLHLHELARTWELRNPHDRNEDLEAFAELLVGCRVELDAAVSRAPLQLLRLSIETEWIVLGARPHLAAALQNILQAHPALHLTLLAIESSSPPADSDNIAVQGLIMQVVNGGFQSRIKLACSRTGDGHATLHWPNAWGSQPSRWNTGVRWPGSFYL